VTCGATHPRLARNRLVLQPHLQADGALAAAPGLRDVEEQGTEEQTTNRTREEVEGADGAERNVRAKRYHLTVPSGRECDTPFGGRKTPTDKDVEGAATDADESAMEEDSEEEELSVLEEDSEEEDEEIIGTMEISDDDDAGSDEEEQGARREQEPPPPQPPGTIRLGDTDFIVSVDQKLGEGGFGVVLKGMNMKTGESVAIKKLAPNKMPVADIMKEVRILHSMNHRNIIGFRGHVEQGDMHYIVMEVAMMGTLLEQLRAKKIFAEDACRNYFKQLLAGVRHLHERGVVHRDLKLENVLVTSSASTGGPTSTTMHELKITDFGYAHECKKGNDGRFELLKRRCGTPRYSPPEMVTALPYDGFLADVYSLAVCFFELANGFAPMKDACLRDERFEWLARAQQAGRSTTRACYSLYRLGPCPLSPELVQLLDAMLRFDPRKRCTLDVVAVFPWLITVTA